jgi:hypothetical protein
LVQANQTSIFQKKPTTELRPVFDFAAASANELVPLLGFLKKATGANQRALSLANLLANAHFLGD